MNPDTENKNNFLKGFFKTILAIAISFFLLLGCIIVAVQIPFIQQHIVNKATEYLSKTLNFPIKIASIDIDWFDQVVLEGVQVKDENNAQMIFIKEAEVDFEVLSLFKAKIVIEGVTLQNGKVNLIKYHDGSLNMDDFIIAINKAVPKSNKKSNPSPFTIPYVRLENMGFSFNDTRKPHIKNFDHNHFTLDSINADVYELVAIRDTFKINVRKLSTYETATFLRAHELNTDYTITKSKMEFKNLNARIGESFIENYLCFHFNKINEMTDFNEKVKVEAHLKNTEISLQDLAFFASDLMPYHDKAVISGDFKGRVVDFGVKNLSFGFGGKSNIKGSLKLKGLPELNETFIEFNYKHLSIDMKDLKQYASKDAFPVLNKFAFVKGTGKFVGFANDFVTEGKCVTGLGQLETDINLKINEHKNPKSYYKGHLKTIAFDFGKLMDKSDVFGFLDMDGMIEGNGFTISEANVQVNAKINRIGINQYNYRNIKTNAELSERLFNGEISVQDSNLVFSASGKVDLRENQNIFNIKAHLDKANLKPLNLEFSKNETMVKTDFYLNFTGLDIDDIEGRASFVNTYLLYNNSKEIFLDSLIVESHRGSDNDRTVTVESNLASAYVTGNFQFTQLYSDLLKNLEEYRLNLDNNSKDLNNYYKNKRNLKTPPKYQIDFDIAIQDVNSILSIYVPNLYVSKGIFITGDYSSGYTSIFNIHTNIDTLYYKENEIYKTEIELSTSKIADSINTLAMLYVSSETQKIKSMPALEKFYFEGIWNNRIIDFHTKVFQKGNNNRATIIGNLAFLENKKKLSLHNSSFNILNQVWNISDHNNVTFSKEEIYFENLAINSGIQSISIDGTISNDRNKESVLKVDNFQMENINSLMSHTKFKGILNGTVLIRDLYKDIDLEGNLLVHQLVIDNFLVGDIKGFSEYNESNRVLEVKVDVERLGNKIMDLSGYIRPAEDGQPEDLSLTANLDNANLEILNPILEDVLSEISGTATGVLKLTGTFDDIILKGIGDVKQGKFKVNYLGTTYYFEDKIYLEENLIGFKKLQLKDENGSHAVINGGLYHDSFRNFVVDINGDMKNFNVLNTEEKDNNIFYGNANVTGDFEILGAFSDLTINANASSNKGTKIFIPLNSTASLEQQDFIKFKSFGNVNDSTNKDNLDLSGIKLEFNLDITPDAYAEIIFDKRAGDIIRGTGEGNIKLKIDTRGDFSMYGDYRILEGYYNFTLAGLINKEFKIKPNSSISWSGDPYTGLLNIDAAYSQYATLLPLIDDTSAAKIPENRRKYPTEVLLNLKGNLLSPEITLGVDILKYPMGLSEKVLAFESNLKVNEQELNKQVFSLLVLGGLSRENSFTGVASSGNNLSEFLSNQLSNWLSQVDENLEIDVNLNSFDKNALNTFQLRMSYTMLEGRLRITREGNFQNVQNSQQANLTNIAGEWTIEYLLSNDGKLRLKVYNKANQNILMNSVGNTGSTSSAGFSILHTQSFNNLKELFRIGKPKQTDEPLQPNTDPTEPPKPAETHSPDGPVNYYESNRKKGEIN